MKVSQKNTGVVRDKMIYKNYKIKDILSERSFELKFEDESKKDEENLEININTSKISSLSNIDLIDYFFRNFLIFQILY